jgi:LmeA-like phospholipid-binding
MFGVFGGLTTPPNTDWGEQMLNTVASQALRHLFTQSDEIEVSVRCYPSSKLLQGSIDGFRMQGKGLVIRRDFEVEEMSFETDAVAIDVKSMLGGKVRLQQPTQAVAQVTLNETGINHAFQAQLVRQRLIDLTLPELTNLSGGEPVSFREVSLKLLPQNQVSITALTDLPNAEAVPIQMTATLEIERRRRICFQNAQVNVDGVPAQQQGLSRVVTETFAEVLNNMVDLDRFDLDGVTLRLNRLETKGEKLLFSGYAQIEHFPGSG